MDFIALKVLRKSCRSHYSSTEKVGRKYQKRIPNDICKKEYTFDKVTDLILKDLLCRKSHRSKPRVIYGDTN